MTSVSYHQERIDAVVRLLDKHKNKFPTIGYNGVADLVDLVTKCDEASLTRATGIIDREVTVCFKKGGKYVSNGDILHAIRNSVAALVIS